MIIKDQGSFIVIPEHVVKGTKLNTEVLVITAKKIYNYNYNKQ